MKAILAFGLLAFAAAGTPWHQLQSYSFQDYVREFNKQYSGSEVAERQSRFEANLALIKKHNEESHSWKMGVNKFTDLTEEEMNQFKGYDRRSSRRSLTTYKPEPTKIDISALPESIDWRDKGVVTPVKNQMQCGSCWAFAAVATIESAVAMSSGSSPPILSAEQVTACTPNPSSCGGTGGCSGATAELAFQYVADNGGIALDSTYPYTSGSGTTGQCLNKTLAATVKGFVKNPENSYAGLMESVVKYGPIAISVDASFSTYSSGIYSGCKKNATLNHAVQLVGYGVENNQKYWIVRNSWGPNWGEKGYIRMARSDDDDNNCGTDPDNQAGSGCKDDPKEVKVCGQCGILYDTAYAVGAKVL